MNFVYEIELSYSEYDFRNYNSILKSHGIEWSSESMSSADVSKLDIQYIVVLLLGAIRAEQSYNGALLGFLMMAQLIAGLEACNEIGYCDIGKAVITPEFNLPVKYVIHAVGPVWHDGNQGEKKSCTVATGN